MRKTTALFLNAALVASLFTACKSGGGTGQGQDSTAATVAVPAPNEVITLGSLRLVPMTESVPFPGSSLRLTEPGVSNPLTPGPITFQFAAEGFALGDTTPGGAALRCANSAKGQHIHYILDNAPYEALYQPTYTDTLTEGWHTLLAFTSRSYHESVKSPDSYVLLNFAVGHSESVAAMAAPALTEPMMFYSRPKGSYVGPAETERVLLDFFIVNTALGADTNRVRVTLNGQSTTLYHWQPYFIEGLELGEHTVKLELLNRNNQPVPGPFNVVERTFKLKPAAN